MINLNLVPPGIKEEVEQSKKNGRILSAYYKVLFIFIAYLLILGGFYFYFENNLATTTENLTQKEKDIEKYGTLEEKSKKIAERINNVKNIENGTYKWSGVIEEIMSIIPNGIYLTSIKADSVEKSRNQITGVAQTKSDVSALRDAMEKSAKFQYVDIENSSTTLDQTTKRESETFTINFSIEKGALK